MTTALRPLTTGELLDRTFSIYRNNFILCAGIAILAPALKLILDLSQAAVGVNPTRALNTSVLGSYFLFLVVYIVGAVLSSAATVYAVSMVHLGKTATIADSYKSIGRYFGRLLLLVVLITLIMVGIAMLVVLPAVLSVAMRDLAALFGILALVGGLVAVVLIVHFYARLSLSMASCVLEKVGSIQAIRRSSLLSKGATGRIWLILLLTGIISAALSFAITVPLVAVATASHMTVFVTTVLLVSGQFVATTLAAPIATVAMVLVYYDQRVRKEAFDLQLMMEAIGQAPQTQAAANPIG
jgi:hypothetical protein